MSTGTRTVDAAEVGEIVKAFVRRNVALHPSEFVVQHGEPDGLLTLRHRETRREFMVEIRAFEVTGHAE